MSAGMLEHVNITVANAKRTADLACRLFDWRIRWQGSGLGGAGISIHVGSDDSYVAIYQPNSGTREGISNYEQTGGLNHIGVVVDDLDAAEVRVKAEGLTPRSHGDYEPGKRFYFDDPNGIEWEVVSYG
ncbi:MAG: VOC family protein [Pseudomonadota bacterium]